MSKNKLYEGINIVQGLQGEGKTYICTHKVVHELLNSKSKRKVLSNYPIIAEKPLTLYQKAINILLSLYKAESKSFKLFNKAITFNKQEKQILQSYVWKDEYTSKPIRDALVIIDETHDTYTGRFAYKFTEADMYFFSKLRHNNVIVFLMSHSYENIHPFLRRSMRYLHEVSKFKLPFMKTPISFKIETYLTIKDYINKDSYKVHKKTRKTILSKEKISFSKLVGSSYRTHQYRDTRPEPDFILWTDELNNANNPIPVRVIDTEPKPRINTNEIKDAVSALIRLGWKKRDATLYVSKIIADNPYEKTDTTEKLIRKSLELKTNQGIEKEPEPEEFDFSEE